MKKTLAALLLIVAFLANGINAVLAQSLSEQKELIIQNLEENSFSILGRPHSKKIFKGKLWGERVKYRIKWTELTSKSGDTAFVYVNKLKVNGADSSFVFAETNQSIREVKQGSVDITPKSTTPVTNDETRVQQIWDCIKKVPTDVAANCIDCGTQIAKAASNCQDKRFLQVMSCIGKTVWKDDKFKNCGGCLKSVAQFVRCFIKR